MKRFAVLIFSGFCLTVFAGAAYAAGHAVTPTTLDGATVVDAEWVKANYQKIFVADVRNKAEYVEEHIRGAVSIPYAEKSGKTVTYDASQDSLDTGKFPAEKATPVIVYCNGPTCWKSYKSSRWLIKAGYTRIYWFREGIPAWKAKGFPVE